MRASKCCNMMAHVLGSVGGGLVFKRGLDRWMGGGTRGGGSPNVSKRWRILSRRSSLL